MGLLEEKKTERMEEEFSLFLRLCSVQSSLQSFEDALRSASQGFSELAPEFSRVSSEVSAGKTVHSALNSFSSRTISLMIKRACAQLCFSYSHGDSTGLKALAKEFEQLQRKKWRDFASKTSFLSVWFVVLSALVPALFSSYVLVGSSFLEFSFPPELVFLSLALGFPLLSFIIVAYVLLQTPGLRL